MNLTDEEWFARLSRRRLEQADRIRSWWSYYEGDQPLYYVAKVLQEQQDRFPPLVINWPSVVVDGVDDRSTVEGFVLDGADERDDDLWNVWQHNDLDEYQSENHVASLVTGYSYVMVGPGDDGVPLVTVESPESVAVEIDPRTRRVVAALKTWKSDPLLPLDDRGLLMLPGRMVEYENQRPVGEEKTRWMAGPRRLQTSPEVPVVPFINQQRQRVGRSEIKKLQPIVDAANQVATNMLAGVEHHATPRKWALNVDPKTFKDADGKALEAWKIANGAVWAVPFIEGNTDAPEPKLGQFPQSDMRNFIEVCTLLSRFATGLYGMPPHMLGFNIGDNPASADGIRASEEMWVRRIEKRQVAFGSSWERVARLALAVMGRDPSQATRLETSWRDPATPTKAALADAALKTYTSGISDLRQARLDYGYSLTQVQAMEKRESEQANAAEERILQAGQVNADAAAGSGQ